METVNRFIYLNELYRCVCQTFKIRVFFNTIPEERLSTTRKRTTKETVNRKAVRRHWGTAKAAVKDKETWKEKFMALCVCRHNES